MKHLSKFILITGILALIIALMCLIDFCKALDAIKDAKEALKGVSDSLVESSLVSLKKDANIFRFIVNFLFYIFLGISCIFSSKQLKETTVRVSRLSRRISILEKNKTN